MTSFADSSVRIQTSSQSVPRQTTSYTFALTIWQDCCGI
jgi:hypothetical protein